MEARTFTPLSFCSLFLLLTALAAQAQQPYVNNKQLDCDNHSFDNITEGYICNGPTSCQSYITFRSEPPYNTAESIARLLNSSASEIQSLNRLSSAAAIVPTRELIVVPVTCSCSGRYYQHNVFYRRVDVSETYFSVANNTYQALTTCQAMMTQNPRYGEKNLTVGANLLVPLRCACPTRNQTAAGFKYLLTYLMAQGDSVDAISETFRSNRTAVLEANQVTGSQTIYFFTPILVPLTTEPTKIQLPPPSPPPPPPTSPAPPPPGSSHKGVFIGLGVGAGLLLAVLLSVFLFCFYKRRSQKAEKVEHPSEPNKLSDSSTKYQDPKSWSINNISSSETLGIKSAIESLTAYRFQDLQAATSNFNESNRIKGSVYRGSFKGDDAAVKVIKGEISSEINLLKKINHSNIVRLSGFCVYQGNTYLVYEYAENGSVNDWIHSDKKYQSCLTWKQRVQIACDVADALNYLHDYITPPCIHKNLKSSNVLLDSNFRAKIANFGLARSFNDDQEGNLQLTRHVIGTQGYLAPEYIENGLITPKLDVFAFGVVVLELLSGKEPATAKKKNNAGEEEEEELLYVLISGVLEGENVREKLKAFIDPCLGNEYPLELAFSLAQLAKNCVARDLNARPSISHVLGTLSMIVSSTMEWEPTDEFIR